MRELFETIPPQNPVAAARKGARPTLQRRFYAKARTVAAVDGFAVYLDDKSILTPARRVLAAPSRALADAIAAEWDAQRELIDPAKMPLTRLANAIIDGVADAPHAVADEIGKYLSSDLLFYRANGPQELRERQARYGDPILAWVRETLGADFKLGQGIVYIAQPEAALVAARAAIPDDPWRLGAMHVVTTLTGSALLALAMARGQLSAEAAWQAADVDEDWNMEQWGRDVAALERRAYRFAELAAAALVLKT
jgi:chaperone required for assembly of F1-ATPase